MFKRVLDRTGGNGDMTVLVNGAEVPAWDGETVASVMLRVPGSGRTTPVHDSPRLPYCQMGVCFECLVIVDDVASTQGCLVPVRPGMRIESQRGPREVLK